MKRSTLFHVRPSDIQRWKRNCIARALRPQTRVIAFKEVVRVSTVPVVKRRSQKPEENVLLKTLIAFKNGDLTVRMPVDLSGLDGKIADTLNEVLALNQRMVSEFDRISRSVGKDGKIAQRASVGSATGA